MLSSPWISKVFNSLSCSLTKFSTLTRYFLINTFISLQHLFLKNLRTVTPLSPLHPILQLSQLWPKTISSDRIIVHSQLSVVGCDWMSRNVVQANTWRCRRHFKLHFSLERQYKLTAKESSVCFPFKKHSTQHLAILWKMTACFEGMPIAI